MRRIETQERKEVTLSYRRDAKLLRLSLCALLVNFSILAMVGNPRKRLLLDRLPVATFALFYVLGCKKDSQLKEYDEDNQMRKQ
jgi:hypothetical protein